MEVKAWTYEEIPEFCEAVEGACYLDTDGDEMGVRYIPNVEYACVDGVHLVLQILQPFTRNGIKTPLPCVVHVQGSAWFAQDLYFGLPQYARLARRGYVVAVVQYRHSGQASFPSQIMDAKNAVRFLRLHSGEYGIDPEKMILSGDSSGGHTAVYAGILHTDGDENDLYPGTSAEVSGILDFYASGSFMAEDSNPVTTNHCGADSPEGLVMGGKDMNAQPELKRLLSLECNITPETRIAPVLIFHGTKDRMVNTTGSVALYRAMKAAGKDATLYLLRGADHGGAEFWTDSILDIADQFIRCLFE